MLIFVFKFDTRDYVTDVCPFAVWAFPHIREIFYFCDFPFRPELVGWLVVLFEAQTELEPLNSFLQFYYSNGMFSCKDVLFGIRVRTLKF